MGQLTIPTTAREDRILAYALNKENIARAQTGQDPLALADLMRLGLEQVYADKAASFDQAEAAALLTAYRAADETTQAAIRAALKVTV